MIRKLFLYLLFWFSFLGFSQEKIVEGKVIVNASLQDIKVENINREISVRTDENGGFIIIADEGEVLVFSSVNTEKKIFFLKKEHFEKSIEVELKTTDIEIEEVEVGKHIVDLGLGGKQLTPAEREYITGGRILKMNQGFEFNLEAIGNLFNGKRKQLKKAVEIEKTNKLLYELDTYFDEDFYLNLGLEPEYIGDFKYFLVEDKDFRIVLESENETEIIMKTIKMYESYQKIKPDEN